MKHRLLSLWCAVGALALSPAMARAADEDVHVDGRLVGYQTQVHLEGGGTTFTWFLLLALAILATVVMFKNARRTHLD